MIIWIEPCQLPAGNASQLHHEVPENPDPLDRHFHRIPFLQRPYSGGRARSNHITRLKSHDAAYELHQFRHVEDQIGGVRLLHHLSVDAGLNICVRGIDFGDPGAEGGEGVEALGARPLHIYALQIAGHHIVEAWCSPGCSSLPLLPGYFCSAFQ